MTYYFCANPKEKGRTRRGSLFFADTFAFCVEGVTEDGLVLMDRFFCPFLFAISYGKLYESNRFYMKPTELEILIEWQLQIIPLLKKENFRESENCMDGFKSF